MNYIKILLIIFLLTELSLQSNTVFPPHLRPPNVQFYKNLEGQLVEFNPRLAELVPDDQNQFYIGVNIGGRIRPMYTSQGQMVRVGIHDHENYEMTLEVANRYGFRNINYHSGSASTSGHRMRG